MSEREKEYILPFPAIIDRLLPPTHNREQAIQRHLTDVDTALDERIDQEPGEKVRELREELIRRGKTDTLISVFESGHLLGEGLDEGDQRLALFETMGHEIVIGEVAIIKANRNNVKEDNPELINSLRQRLPQLRRLREQILVENSGLPPYMRR